MTLATLRRASLALSVTVIVTVALFILVAKAIPWLDRPFPGFKYMGDDTVQNLLPNTWTGFQAGLHARDMILTFDGRPMKGLALYDYVVSKPVGTRITYKFARYGLDGRQTLFSRQIATQRWDLANWISYFLANWLSGLSYLAIALFVSYRKPKDPIAKAHLGFCMSYAIFMVTVFSQCSDFTFGSVIPEAVLMTLASIMALNLGMQFPRPMGGWVWRLFGAMIGVLVMVAALALNPFPAFRLDSHLLLFAYLGVASLSVVVNAAWTAIDRRSSGRERAQGKIVLAGLLGPVILGIGQPLLSYMGLTIPIFGLDCLINLTLPVAIAYAVVRHQLFDVDVLLRPTLTYSVVASILLVAYSAIVAGIPLLIGYHGPISSFLATMLIAVAFAPLRDRIKKWLDATWFRPAYDFEAVASGFVRDAQAGPEPATLAAAFLQAIDSALAPTWATVVRMRPTGPEPLAQIGRVSPDLGAAAISNQLLVLDEPIGRVTIGPFKSELAPTERDRQLVALLSHQLAIRLDVWDRQESYLAQRSEIEALQRSQELQGHFLNLVSHELRTPLSVTMSSLNLLRLHGDPDRPTLDTHLGHIQRSSAQLKHLVNDLLNAGQLAAGAFHLHRRPCSLSAIVTDLAPELEQLARDKGHQLKFILDQDLLPLSADPRRLEQVARNMVVNAIKYTARNGSITASVSAVDSRMRFAVTDNGPGIAPDDQPRLFQRFGTTGGSGTQGGVGLGLYIARELVEAHGGQIGFESVPGGGSTFWFELPVAVPDPRSQCAVVS